MEHNNSNYIESILEHVAICTDELANLNAMLKTTELTNIEYAAAEHLLQQLIESAIGFAKRMVKKLNHPVPSDAYSCFKVLYDNKIISNDELIEWRKIIGLRNAIVHDYLNINKDIIVTVINNQHYVRVAEFIISNKTQL